MINQKSAVFTAGSEEVVRVSINDLSAIALGVEARYDLLTGYSIAVVETTVQTARQIGIPEREIQQWKAARSALHAKKDRVIKLENESVVPGYKIYSEATSVC